MGRYRAVVTWFLENTLMSFRWTIKLPQGPSLAILLGFVAFFLITGGKILWPTYIDWLLAGDPATHWIGWQYFRYTPLLQWPIGANPDLGMEIGSSIVFTDSIPLMAFLFKPLNVLLPDTFQYTGLWILMCFSLQSFFAWKLLSLFTKDKYLPLIGSIFFIIAPIGLWRLGGHYALFGHWVLLAGLYLYFTKDFSIYRWSGLLASTALIHAYLLAMVLAIWSADLIQRCCLKHVSLIKALSYFIVGSTIVAFMMWAAGYFMVGKGVGLYGYGFARLNLLALIDPKDMYSTLLPALKTAITAWTDADGFNFLGLGMLALGMIAGYILLRNVTIISKTISKAKLIPILFISMGLFLYAISNRIAIGPYELLSYPMPPITEILTSAFRCSGRFFWPVYYAIYLAIFYILFTRSKRHVAITLCVGMLFAQLIDSKDAWIMIRNQFAHPAEYVVPLNSPVWSNITHPYRKIIFVPSYNGPIKGISFFAAEHQMATNANVFARVNPEKEQKSKENITTAILNNELSPDSLYVFVDNHALWRIASNQIGPSDAAGVLDGYRIIAPKLRDCKTCNVSAIASSPVRDSHRLDYKMERLSFKLNGNGQKYQVYGWSEAEEWGTWSDGDASAILLPLSITPKNDLDLLLDGHAFIGDKHPSQEVGILVNGHYLATLTYDQQSNDGMRVVKIPRSLVLEKNGQLLINFKIKNPKFAADLGFLSTDPRRLGLCIASLELKTVD